MTDNTMAKRQMSNGWSIKHSTGILEIEQNELYNKLGVNLGASY
jgi:hypothetical protein